jgi:ABC-type transporter Mla subunit MlaD
VKALPRRLVAVVLVVAAAAAAVALARPGGFIEQIKERVESKLSGVDNVTYRVDALFDTAKGVQPGQVVKVAGARAGTIHDVTLARGPGNRYQARIEMRVDSRFAPFRSDARCAIQPEGLIGERFVQCDPGSPAGKRLAASGGTPTVPVARTSTPIGLTELFQIFNAPVRQRIPLVFATLGLGTAGRGGDLNDVLRRANPTLAQTHAVLRILRRQRRELASGVSATDRVLAQIAPRRARLRSLVASAARVTGRTASRRGELAVAVRRLPPLLDSAEPALQRLQTLARAGTPLLADLRASAPDLERLLARTEPFANAALPTVTTLGQTLPTARSAVGSARPTVAALRVFARRALPTGRRLADLVVDLRDRGGVDNLLVLVYRLAATMGRYDTVSHLFPVLLNINSCSVVATEPDPKCDAHWDSPAQTAQLRSLDYLLK